MIMGALPQTSSVSVEEYLHKVYRPDLDYVDGTLVDRNVGEKDHSKLQKRFLLYLDSRSEAWNIFVIQETRMRVSPTRYRVPDLCVFVGPEPDEQVFTQPPFLCIEILSPEDRMSRMQVRIKDYLNFGVRYVWLVDPESHAAWIYTAEGMYEVRDGILRTENSELTVPLAEVFD
jgi:Uma2 family endonuclease